MIISLFLQSCYIKNYYIHIMPIFSQEFIDLIDQPLCLLDDNLNIIVANQGYIKITGQDDVKSPSTSLFHFDPSKSGRPFRDEIIHAIAEKGKWFGVIHTNHYSGSFGLAVTIERIQIKRHHQKNAYLCKVQASSQRQESYLETDHKHLFELIFNSTQNIVFILQEAESGLSSKIIEANSRALAALHLTAEQLFQTNFIDLLKEAGRAEYLILSDELSEDKAFDCKLTLNTSTGSELHLEGTMSRVLYENKKTILLVARNLNEQKELENKLSQIEKLEAVGQLAGGIAHDFNNVLAGISGLAELSLRKLEADHPATSAIKTIHKKANNTANMVRQLVAFSRKQSLNIRDININKVIRNNQKLLERYLGEDVQFCLELSNNLGMIKADQSAIDQIITNLCINARDAMPDGGKLTINTQNILIESNQITPSGKIPYGKYIKLSVCDTGIGISREIQSHIFEPFYTTKDIGYGTGLGLSIVYGLIKQHKGFIECKSDIGEGTCFEMFFPRQTGIATVVEKKAEIGNLKGSESILIVEDEADLILYLKESLEYFGYKTILANNGSKALELYEMNLDKIDLIVSDVVMPEMGGVELKLVVQKMKPDQKILLISAYTNRIEPGVPFLQKPFRSEELAWAVRQILDNTYNLEN